MQALVVEADVSRVDQIAPYVIKFSQKEIESKPLLYAKHNGSAPDEFRDHRGNGIVANLDDWEVHELGLRLGLPVPTPQESCDAMLTNEEQRDLGTDYFHYDEGMFIKQGRAYSFTPKITKVAGKFDVSTDTRQIANFNGDDMLANLESVELFQQRYGPVSRGGVYFDSQGRASPGSGWHADGGRPSAGADWPARRRSYGAAVFAGTADTLVQVGSRKLAELQWKAQRYDTFGQLFHQDATVDAKA